MGPFKGGERWRQAQSSTTYPSSMRILIPLARTPTDHLIRLFAAWMSAASRWPSCLHHCSTSTAFNFALSTTTTFGDTTTTSHIFAPMLPSACLHLLY